MTDARDDPRFQGLAARVLANAGTLLGGRTVNAIVGLAYIALTARSLGKET
jgi:O-antigen/teichoic acid export membrane protein